MNYTQANSLLQGKCWSSRKVGNNTYLARYLDHLALDLHRNTIIKWFPNGRIVLSSKGWRTVTTKARLNEYLQGYAIRQEKGVWYLFKGENYADKSFPFFDGIVIGARGKINA